MGGFKAGGVLGVGGWGSQKGLSQSRSWLGFFAPLVEGSGEYWLSQNRASLGLGGEGKDQELSSRDSLLGEGGAWTAALPTGAGLGLVQGLRQQSSGSPCSVGGPLGGQGRPSLEGIGGALGGRGAVILIIRLFLSTSSRHCIGMVEAADFLRKCGW